jgi:glutamine amidotransferase-like uncharacterized protein
MNKLVGVLLVSLGVLAGSVSGQQPTMSEYERVNLERNLRWMLERERAANKEGTARPRRVGVYADAGVWHVGLRSVVELLETEGVPCAVLDRSRLRAEELRGFDVLVLPGGWAPLQWASAGEQGLQAIRTFVESGGRCVGICAGAYLLSKTVKYDGKEYGYPLGLFDGTATGPVENLAPYPQAGSARLRTTEAGGKCGLKALDQHDVFYSGGPHFERGTGVTVLAEYANGSAAIISRKVGKGDVVLLGGHAERPPPPPGDDAAPPRWAGAVLKALACPGSRSR